MKYPAVEISSISQLIENLQAHIGEFDGPIWFRGQANEQWGLEPKLMRQVAKLPETYYLNRFKQDASIILNHKPAQEFEWLFLMQHYGVPTRLLDWSESSLVALYFAIIDQPAANGSLYVLLPTELNKINNYESEYPFEIPSFDDVHLETYKPSSIVAELKSKLKPIAAIAPRNSTRMQAQQGVFTIIHRENIHIDNLGEGFTSNHIWKYTIPSAHKANMLRELKLLGITKFQLFPELESLSTNFI